MIKHIVMWRLKETAMGNTKKENALIIKQKLEALKSVIPGIIKMEVGIDFSGTEASSDVVLYSEFESREALNNYQDHPEHDAVRNFVKEVRTERRLVDYKI